MAFEHRESCLCGLNLGVGDAAFLLGRAGEGGIVIGLGRGEVGTGAGCVVLCLIECLLRGEILTREGRGPGQLHLQKIAARIGLGDFVLQGLDLFMPHAGIDVVAVRRGCGQCGPCLLDLCGGDSRCLWRRHWPRGWPAKL